MGACMVPDQESTELRRQPPITESLLNSIKAWKFYSGISPINAPIVWQGVSISEYSRVV